MRENFSDPEWVDMQVLVFWVLLRVASADGTLSKDEWAEILAAVKRVSASTTLIGQLSASISYAQHNPKNQHLHIHPFGITKFFAHVRLQCISPAIQ